VIQPERSDDAFLDHVRATAAAGDGHFRLWWLGQSGYLLQWAGRHLLIDPYLSDSLTRKYAATDKPHVRMTALVVDPVRLDFIDVATSSHNHTDHLDQETLGPLMAANPALRLVIPEASRAFVAERLKCDPAWPIGLNDDGLPADVSGFRIWAVPAAHETVDRDADGRCLYLGYVFEFGPWKIYHSGDTVLYNGMAERLRDFRVDVALLPINGTAPERRVAGNLDGEEAAGLARDMEARTAIPCHYEMFTFNTASPGAFVAACQALGQPFRVLQCGGRFSSEELE
jgi:L-ascorbate metabolism protein UlaG (beta-lactamase superfamily)